MAVGDEEDGRLEIAGYLSEDDVEPMGREGGKELNSGEFWLSVPEVSSWRWKGIDALSRGGGNVTLR